ncbi:MAG: hypothetical protein HUK40_23700 [Desulfobacter sp.]|nr:hypothetical protein [Desulfobacter sp.]WDP86763.1 MAG: hypothetical protein HUN05_17895 [Desulfobacter sp.]
MSDKKLRELVENHVPGLFVIIVVFAIIEFGILLACVAYSANQDMVKIYGKNNEPLYENVYNLSHINEFKKLYGIDNFQESGFVLTRMTIENKFPTRAWIALSVCVPLVLILFVVFIVKVFEDMFHSQKENTRKKDDPDPEFEETRFEKLFSTLGRLNIYALGTTVILTAFLFWMVPDLLVYLGKVSYETISELKWVILGIILLGGLYLIFKAYFSYKTKIQIIKHQAVIQQHRDRLAIEAKTEKKRLEDKTSHLSL